MKIVSFLMRLFLYNLMTYNLNSMKTTTSLIALILLLTVSSCSKNINYSPEHITQTSGRYLYDQSEVIDIFYDQNNLFVKWKGVSKKPVVLDENTFFVADIYKKLRFVKHPDNNKRYLGVVSEDDNAKLTFEYPKVDDHYKTPRMYLNDGDFDAAIAGFLELKNQDSTKMYIEERNVNSIGYNLLEKKNYKDAIAVFEMNTVLYPDSHNVYGTLAEAYLTSGDSLQAYANYKKDLELNPKNKRAKKFVFFYEKNGR